ncbi:hypothetical protein HPP92_005000 [Vanilla planifolia]|nr:hypothetical protein HPP92_005000 [Vanilla planifolia]
MQFAASTASLIPNVEIFVFYPCSAISSLFFLQQGLGKLDENPILPGLHTRVSMHDCISDGFREFFFRQMRSQTAVIAGRIMNTSHAIEGAILDELLEEWKMEHIFAVGPLNPGTAVNGEHHEDECVQWLDQQPTASVIYVSFGTTSTVSSEQLRELAAGLAASDQRFLWVLRDADRCDVFAAGPDARHVDQEAWTELEEILKRVGEKGKVVQGRAPQMEILAHPSTGGFISHCGWNSLMEAAGMGVPILAWPMHSDQPINAELVTTVLRTGMWIREWGDRGEMVTAAKIKEAITRLMTGEEGKEVTRRAREIGQKLRAAVDDGGCSKDDLDGFIARVSRP